MISSLKFGTTIVGKNSLEIINDKSPNLVKFDFGHTKMSDEPLTMDTSKPGVLPALLPALEKFSTHPDYMNLVDTLNNSTLSDLVTKLFDDSDKSSAKNTLFNQILPFLVSVDYQDSQTELGKALEIATASWKLEKCKVAEYEDKRIKFSIEA